MTVNSAISFFFYISVLIGMYNTYLMISLYSVRLNFARESAAHTQCLIGKLKVVWV